MKKSKLRLEHFRLLKSLFPMLIVSSFVQNVGLTQVPTYVLKDQKMENLIPYHLNSEIQPSMLPEVNVKDALEEDIKNGRTIPRFGIKVHTDLSEKDGQIIKYGKIVVWRKSIKGSNAVSLNFVFTNLILPEGAEMYIYNKSETMYSGPIKKENIFYNRYSTDIFIGNEVIIDVVIPQDVYSKFKISLTYVIYGFRTLRRSRELREYDDSGSCEIDVKCSPFGSGWGNESNAVAEVISTDGTCSGCLINSSCTDLKSYLLTADHCLSGSGHQDWNFRFNYDSPNPNQSLNACRGDEPTSWITYSGATLRANFSSTDFALVELDGSIIGQPTISLAGFDRSSNTHVSTITIHHPMGDVKKISNDFDAPVVEGYLGFGTANHFKVIWDVGVTEDGSSGGALFDEVGHKIIGQLHGGDSDCDNTTDPDWFGRLLDSWTGGGTSSTRLSDWLGSSTTTNTVLSPYIGTVSVGPLCTTNRTFTLNNLISGRSATWAVTPTSLFATTSGASISGTGTSAVLRSASSASSGLATLTFTISSGGAGCSTIPVSYPIWVGYPGGYLEGDQEICVTEEGFININWAADNAQMGVYSTVWSYTGPIDNFNGGPALAKYSSSTTGHGTIYVTRTNACGIQSLSIPYQIITCQKNSVVLSDFKTEIFPNPSSDKISVLIKSEDNVSIFNEDILHGTLNIYNKYGQKVINQKFFSNLVEVNSSSLNADIYIVEIIIGERSTRNKLMIVK